MMKKPRWILQTLILSVVFNALLLFLFFYFCLRDTPLRFSYQQNEEILLTSCPIPAGFLQKLQTLSFEQLVELLDDTREIEYGYSVRDIALGVLVVLHDFDIEKGLARKLTKRKWVKDSTEISVFPGLQDADFECLKLYSRKHRWPITSKGLFKCIQKNGIEKSDPALLEFFTHTPEFILLETLFMRTRLPIQKGNILALAVEGGWGNLESFFDRQQLNLDLSEKTRRAFLIKALEANSKTAAYLYLITDFSYAVKNLNDSHVIKMLELLSIKTQEALHFAQVTALSPRSELVVEKANKRLSEYMRKDEIAGHFIEKPVEKKLRPSFRQAPPAAPQQSVHIVEAGESLWSISRKYKISLEALMQANHLQSTEIRPGMSLHVLP